MRLLFIGLLLVLTACGTPSSENLPETAAPTTEGAEPSFLADRVTAQVVYVSDGDSFEVEVAGSEERVRMIGINTPEKGECYGTEARQALVDLIDGQVVSLVSDVESTDQYGRILAYVYAGDVFVNEEMARLGAALARPYEPNTTLQPVLDAAEAEARDAFRGMWSADTCGGEEDPAVVIAEVHADAPGRDGENLNGEYVVLESLSEETFSLAGWTLRDESSVHRYVFPSSVTIEPGAGIVVFTGCGQDEASRLYWCSDSPVWDNGGDTAFLLDLDGTTRHRFGY